MKKNLRHNFRINTTLIVIALIAFTLLGICVYLDSESKYLTGSQFSQNQSKSNKFRITLPQNYKYHSGTVIPVSNYNQYKKVSKQYKFDNQNNLNLQEFKDNNYLYVITGESGCIDSAKFEYYTINDNRVDIYFSENNCSCLLSRLDTYVYEILFPEEIVEDMIFNINYLINEREDLEICDLSK